MKSHKILPILALVSLAACSSHHDEEVHKASLSRTLNMVDAQNVRYGTVELNPVGGGRVYDVDGRLIGDIVPNDAHH